MQLLSKEPYYKKITKETQQSSRGVQGPLEITYSISSAKAGCLGLRPPTVEYHHQRR